MFFSLLLLLLQAFLLCLLLACFARECPDLEIRQVHCHSTMYICTVVSSTEYVYVIGVSRRLPARLSVQLALMRKEEMIKDTANCSAIREMRI